MEASIRLGPALGGRKDLTRAGYQGIPLPHEREEKSMADVIFVALGVVAFALLLVFVRAVDHL